MRWTLNEKQIRPSSIPFMNFNVGDYAGFYAPAIIISTGSWADQITYDVR